MDNKDKVNKLVDDALNSVDSIKRAAARPYLLTRINARMSRGAESIWEKAGWFIGRPVVAFTGLCMIIFINVMVIMLSKSATTEVVTEQVAQAPADEFSYTVATIYDFENVQP